MVKKIIKRTRKTVNVIINGGVEYDNGNSDGDGDGDFSMKLVNISIEESKAKKLS